jgi:DNA-binding response OmpR family regulator
MRSATGSALARCLATRYPRAFMKVLLVDGDAGFREFVRLALEAEGIEHELASDGDAALALLEARDPGAFDVVLLDIELPGPKGWDLLLAIRERDDEVPVIFVSGLERVEDRVRGLRLGADDYLVKPIEFEELLARMDAVGRRRRSMTPIEFGDLTLDLARRKALRAGHAAHLTPREFDLLLALARAEGAVVPRAELLRDVWDLDFDPGTNVLDVHVGRLRKKIDRHGLPLIETVRREGYRLVRRAADAR